MFSPTVPSTFHSASDVNFDDDVAIVNQPEDVLRMWHHISGSSRDRVLGSTLINYALSSGAIHVPSMDIRAHVPTLLEDPALDPWDWTLAGLKNVHNPTYILNAFHSPVSFTYRPINLITFRRLFFERPRTPVNSRSRDAFSPDNVADTSTPSTTFPLVTSSHLPSREPLPHFLC
ncbi:hypothetical protein CF326_g9711 [Tilletia indica]|nr:hypothetical protein CF326_g9711 [Tilletia indica]